MTTTPTTRFEGEMKLRHSSLVMAALAGALAVAVGPAGAEVVDRIGDELETPPFPTLREPVRNKHGRGAVDRSKYMPHVGAKQRKKAARRVQIETLISPEDTGV